ncbi:MAG: NAD-dependent epimerase/dehydratase family protein [Flavobacteriales bacterium]
MDLVTGGTGIVGIHVLLERTTAGAPVRALFRKDADRSIVERVFRHYSPDADTLLARIEWVEGDLMDTGSLREAMSGVMHVYHAAALVSFDPRDAEELQNVNVKGTANVVNAGLDAGVNRLCHVSSTASIGKAPGEIERDEDLPWVRDKHVSDYAVSKYEAELEVQRGIAEGLDAVIVNPCIVLGPGLSGRSSMPMVERVARGTSFFPPGSNAVVDAGDVAACMVALMERGASGERYLLVGENVTYEYLFNELAQAFGKRAPWRRIQPWMLSLAWRVERMRSMVTRGRSLVTRNTAHSALITRAYSNKKITELLGYRFRSAREAVANVAGFMKGRQG